MVQLEYLHRREGGTLNKVFGNNFADCLKKIGYDFVKASVAKEIYLKAVNEGFPCGCKWVEGQKCEKCKKDHLRADVYWYYLDHNLLDEKADKHTLFVIPSFGDFFAIQSYAFTEYEPEYRRAIKEYKRTSASQLEIEDSQIEALVLGNEEQKAYFMESFEYFNLNGFYENDSDFFNRKNKELLSLFDESFLREIKKEQQWA